MLCEWRGKLPRHSPFDMNIFLKVCFFHNNAYFCDIAQHCRWQLRNNDAWQQCMIHIELNGKLWQNK